MKFIKRILFASAAVAAVASLPASAGQDDRELSYISFLKDLKMMQMYDRNADHRVTRTEFMKFSEDTFRKLDRNHDGVVDETEWTTGGA